MVPSKLPKEAKEHIIQKIQEYFELERSEEIGSMAAEFLLDFMLKELGPYLYNQAIEDAKRLLDEKLLSIEEDLYALQRPISLVNRRTSEE